MLGARNYSILGALSDLNKKLDLKLSCCLKEKIYFIFIYLFLYEIYAEEETRKVSKPDCQLYHRNVLIQ